MLPNTQKAPVRSRRIIEVGLTNLLTCDAIFTEPNAKLWPSIFLSLLDLFTLPQDITYADEVADLDPSEGFQASFSKLGASEKAQHDPIPGVPESRKYASKKLAETAKARPGALPPLIQQAQQQEEKTVTEFVNYMSSNGDVVA